MYSRLPALCISVAVFFFSSFSKDSGPPPPPSVLDTLSAGWQRIYAIQFLDPEYGWVVSYENFILRYA